MKITFTVDRFEADKAVLADGKHSIVWPKELLPENSKEGSAITFMAYLDAEEEKARKEFAKDILNEILDTGS